MSRRNTKHQPAPAPESESESESGSYSYYSDSDEESGSGSGDSGAATTSTKSTSTKSTSTKSAMVKPVAKQAKKLTSAKDVLKSMQLGDDDDDDQPADSFGAPARGATVARSGYAELVQIPNNMKKKSAKPDYVEVTTKAPRTKKQLVADDTDSASADTITVPTPAADSLYYVGFIHQVGLRKDEIPIKVWASNNIAADRKSWESGVPAGLKTHSALHCVSGDAKNVIAAWDKMNAAKAIPKSKAWYNVSKKTVDDFVAGLTRNSSYVVVTEAKAKFKTSS